MAAKTKASEVVAAKEVVTVEICAADIDLIAYRTSEVIRKRAEQDKAADPVPPADPWVHRSQGMRCKTCMWFVPKVPDQDQGPGPAVGLRAAYDVGRCRRHAPAMSGYPVVFVNDWCGDHRLNENAI